MLKNIILLILILNLGIKSDFVDDNYSDMMNCINTDIDKCTSTGLKTKNLECCRFEIEYLNGRSSSYEDDDDANICHPVFTTYVSQSMMNQIESIAIENYGILKAYLDIDIPRLRETITCTSTKATYEFGGYTYTSTDIKKLKSKNHCLYLYYNSIGQNLFNDESISIDKEKCVNAESLDVTKGADIYCAYADAAILYSDGTKNEFKTCYFLPSESIKSKKLDPTTEAALQRATSNEATKDGKTIEEYEVKMVDKTGRTLTYNSVEGVITSSNNSNKLRNFNIFLYIFIILIL
jgi:hypothetical protein